MLSKVTLGCAAVAAVGAKQAATGTNAGGWLVLEPWITPSLFYRFLGKDEDHTAMDSWTLCERTGVSFTGTCPFTFTRSSALSPSIRATPAAWAAKRTSLGA